MEIKNLFKNLPDIHEDDAEFFQTIVENSCLKIEHIISKGQATPPGQWYDQDWDEWVILLQGSAGVLFEGDTSSTTLEAGDYFYIPARKRHRVEWTGRNDTTVWLAIHIKLSKKGKAKQE